MLSRGCSGRVRRDLFFDYVMPILGSKNRLIVLEIVIYWM